MATLIYISSNSATYIFWSTESYFGCT